MTELWNGPVMAACHYVLGILGWIRRVVGGDKSDSVFVVLCLSGGGV